MHAVSTFSEHTESISLPIKLVQAVNECSPFQLNIQLIKGGQWGRMQLFCKVTCYATCFACIVPLASQ